jgi:hypothetical protein
VLGRVRGPRALGVLRRHLGYLDQAVRLEVLQSLQQCAYAAAPETDEAARVRSQLDRELADASWTLAAWRGLPPRPDLATLRRALLGEMGRSREAILLLLSFVHDPVAILRAREGLGHGSREKRAYALEVLDVTLDREIKAPVLAFLEAHGAALAAGDSAEPGQAGEGRAASPDAVHALVLEIAQRPRAVVSAWTTGCAVQAVALLEGDGWEDVLARSEADGAALVRETATWARVRKVAGRYRQGGAAMLTIERVISLKTVPMFEGVSEEILADVAALMEEVDYKAGDVVFEKGAPGDSLYIVVSGRVRVYDEAHTIVELGEKEMFGELALLDPEPRLASIAAVQDTRLFRLDGESFAELMAGNIEVVRGVLHVLCERLRGQGSYAPDRPRVDRAG